MYKSVKEQLYHLINGIRSGIPLCCVIFFLRYHNTYKEGLGVHTLNKRGKHGRRSKGYVVCDACFGRQNFVKVKDNGVIFRSLVFDKQALQRFKKFDVR